MADGTQSSPGRALSQEGRHSPTRAARAVPAVAAASLGRHGTKIRVKLDQKHDTKAVTGPGAPRRIRAGHSHRGWPVTDAITPQLL